MEVKNYFATDASGNILGSAQVFLYLAGTTTLATGIQNISGAALSNPFTAQSNGLVQFQAPDKNYDMRVVKLGRDFTIRIQCFDGVAFLGSLSSESGSSLIGYIVPSSAGVSTTVQSRLQRVIYVDDFIPAGFGDGVKDDLPWFTAAANYAQTLKNGANRTPEIVLSNKAYFLSAPTPPATWRLPPGADINGLPGVSPSFQTDTSRLTGQIIRLSGIDQYTTFYVGDPAYNSQKKTGRVLASQIMGASNRAAGGVSGFTYTSGRDGADQASIAVGGQGYNDNVTTPKTVWGLYGEGIRALAGTGNAFGSEVSSFNYAPVISSNPYQQPGETTGVTVGLWLSALGDFDSTSAVGIITAGRKWQKGIQFYQNSLATDEAVVMPYGYRMGWYLSGASGMASYVKSDILQQYAVNGPCYTRGVRGGATSANNDLIKFDSWSGNNGGTEVVLADSRLYQVSNFSGGFAGSRWDWSVRNAAGATTRLYLSATAHRPEANNAVSSGELGSSWSSVFATQVRPGAGNVIWTSGAGSPEGAVTALVGSMYTRTDGGAGTTLYVKETGSGNTGWAAK